MTQRHLRFLIFIAMCAAFFPATAQTVYRCGSTYSQVPCPGAVAVDTRDVRTQQQKSEKDKANERNAAVASAMEKKRLKEEAQAEKVHAANRIDKSNAAAPGAKRADTTPHTKDAKAERAKKKKTKAQKKASPYFTANAPSDKKKPEAKPAPSAQSPAAQ